MALGAGMTAVLAGLAFAAYKDITRQPRSEWIIRFIERHPAGATPHITLWVPGVSTRANYQHMEKVRRAVGYRGRRERADCPVAFFPYSSKVVALDLVAALMDKLDASDLRPQIVNIQLAISQFLHHYQTVSIVCHSHGALLVHRALEGLGLQDLGGRVAVSAFGPAHLVMKTAPKYRLRFAVNWVNMDDVLLQWRILRLPPVRPDGEVHTYAYEDGEVTIVARDNQANPQDWESWCPGDGLKPGGRGIGAHSCYPFQAGLFCKPAPPVVDLTGLAGDALLNKFSAAANDALPG